MVLSLEIVFEVKFRSSDLTLAFCQFAIYQDMSSPCQDHSCFCLLNKVGQSFGKYGIKGHFKLSIRYFDAKIRPFPSVKYNLFFTNCGISYEFEGNCFLV